MNYKEFYIWLDGFMTNRSWTVIQQTDIECIQNKMKDVNDGFDIEKFRSQRPKPLTIKNLNTEYDK
jgi:hypothetical protein